MLGILMSLTAALSKVDDTEANEKDATSTEVISNATTPTKESTKSIGSVASRLSKSEKSPGENRGKRTLYDFGNAGYLYSDVANRRAGFTGGGATQNYYPQTGYYNGQSAFAQYPQEYTGHFSHYPQYLEAPEPIIEIIIKDSNETLPEPPQEPIITRKKKEKVHVFYVNYKKDHNNKLHLESPIASLNNDDTTEEEEEILQIPIPVTQAPPLKSTTLRTIIHPDSEKYHSNSGIHVTFGTDDKSQTGHILEENDAESIQSHVVALPPGSDPNALAGLKSDAFSAREDSRAPSSNQLFDGPLQRNHYYQTEQQLPVHHNTQFFRTQGLLSHNQVQPPTPPQTQSSSTAHHHNKFQQSHAPPTAPQLYQKLPNTQPPRFLHSQASLLPQPQSLHRKAPAVQQQVQLQQQQHQQQQHQQAHYYSNFNQEFQHQTPFYQTLTTKFTQPPKSSFVFPTAPPKLQELPSRQSATQYEPIKFRPTPAPLPQIKPVPIPAKLENTNYQTQQTSQYFKSQSNHQKSKQQYQQPQSSKTQTQPLSPYYFNRQPQFVRNPSFTVLSPTIPATYKIQPQSSGHQETSQYPHQKVTQSNTIANNYQSTVQTQSQPQKQFENNVNEQIRQQNYQQSPISATIPQAATNNAHQLSPNLGSLQNYFDIQPSKETELLKSIPKFEQHITETIHHPTGAQYQGQTQNAYSAFSVSNRNQVIHDIPAPNLGPASQSPIQQSPSNYLSPTAAPITGHYITASNLNSQGSQQLFSSFVTASPPTTTAAPQFAQSPNGQKIMIVTPMPPIIYNQYHSSQYNNQDQSNSQQLQQQIQHQLHQQQSQRQQQEQEQLQQQQHQNQQQQQSIQQQQAIQQQFITSYVQQPRQSQSTIQSTVKAKESTGNSPFSVSTFHSDVFKELEQQNKQREYRKQQNSQQHQEIQQQKQQDQHHKQQNEAGQQSVINSQQSSQNSYIPQTQNKGAQTQNDATSVQQSKSPQNLFQLPDEVPDDLREQLLSSGILNNADISVLDYDKIGAVNLENLPAEHLQHFYGNGGGAQISESNRVLTVVKPNGEQVSLSEKELERVKTSNSIPKKHNLDVKVVRFGDNNQKSVTDKYLKPDATIVPPVDISDRHYNRYLPLKINGAQFPLPDVEELQGKKVVSVVVLAPVDGDSSSERRSSNTDANSSEAKEIKFLNGDLIKTLVKKPTKENFKRWLEREAKTDVEQQSVVLLVTNEPDATEQEIFMYDISTGIVNKLNGELSSKFVSVAEDNASTEDLEHASTLDPSALEQMMQPSASHS